MCWTVLGLAALDVLADLLDPGVVELDRCNGDMLYALATSRTYLDGLDE